MRKRQATANGPRAERGGAVTVAWGIPGLGKQNRGELVDGQ